MKITKITAFIILLSTVVSCKKQLDIQNINEPNLSTAATEAGVISLAQGTIYRNGFYSLKYEDDVFGRFWSGATGFHELIPIN